MGFQVVVSDSVVNMIYLLSCISFFGMSSYHLFSSLPRLRKAVLITLNSLTIAAIKRDRRYFYGTQRAIDLAVTVPVSAFWLGSTLLTLAITLGHQSIPLEAQSYVSAIILPAFLMYMILDLPDSQELKPEKFKSSRFWL